MGVDAEFIFDSEQDDDQLIDLESKINKMIEGEIVETCTLIRDDGVEYDGNKVIVLLGLRYRIPGKPKCENDGTARLLDKIAIMLLDSGVKNLAYCSDDGQYPPVPYTRGMIYGVL